MEKKRAITILQTLMLTTLVSFGTVLLKIALSEVPPFTLTWLSIAVGMIVLSLYTFLIRGERIPRGLDRQIWIYIVAIGLLNFVVGRISRPFALERLPATTTTYLGNFIGFVTMGMSVFILKEPPTLFQVLGAVFAFLGLRIFYNEAPTSYELVGVGLILIGILAVATTNNIARKVAIVTEYRLSNNIISTTALLIGGSITVLVGLLIDWPPQVSGWRNWAIIVYTGIFGVGIFLTAWNYLLRTLRSYEASILGASTVIWTALLAIPILGERLQINQIIGMGMLIFGLGLVQVRRGKYRGLFRRSALRERKPARPPAER